MKDQNILLLITDVKRASSAGLDFLLIFALKMFLF